MKRETIAIHAGYDGDPTTKAVAVPIYQTVAFEFDSAEHGAALFNLEVQGNIYTRIGNPTNTVLEKRVAALEGGVDALSVSSGMAAIEYSLVNIAEPGNNIVSLPQLYGATYTLLAHIFPKRGIASRFAKPDRRKHPGGLLRERGQSCWQRGRH
jgi:O-acetylhomoserine (thiol)-lyase